METLKQRLEEQKGRHQGGNKWIGTGGTPRDTARRLNEAAAKALRAPEVGGKLSGAGLEVIAGTPEEFEQSIRRQLEAYARLVKASGAKVD